MRWPKFSRVCTLVPTLSVVFQWGYKTHLEYLYALETFVCFQLHLVNYSYSLKWVLWQSSTEEIASKCLHASKMEYGRSVIFPTLTKVTAGEDLKPGDLVAGDPAKKFTPKFCTMDLATGETDADQE